MSDQSFLSVIVIMKKEKIKRELGLISKTTLLDNAVLRHYLKKYKLNDTEAIVSGYGVAAALLLSLLKYFSESIIS